MKIEVNAHALLKETGATDKLGRLRRWSPATVTALRKAGHSSLDFGKCSCQTNNATNTTVH